MTELKQGSMTIPTIRFKTSKTLGKNDRRLPDRHRSEVPLARGGSTGASRKADPSPYDRRDHDHSAVVELATFCMELFFRPPAVIARTRLGANFFHELG